MMRIISMLLNGLLGVWLSKSKRFKTWEKVCLFILGSLIIVILCKMIDEIIKGTA